MTSTVETAQLIRTEPLSWKARWVIFLCSVVFFLDGMLPAILGPLAPSIAQTLNLGPGDLGSVFSATIVGQSFGLVLMPMAARFIGHKRVIVIAVLGFGLAQAGAFFVHTRDMLIGLRVMEGFCIGGGYPSCMVVVAAAVPKGRRAFALMLLFAGLSLGNSMAGVIGRWFIDGELWRMAFLITGLVAVCMGLITWRFLNVEVSDATDESKTPRRFREIAQPPLLWGTMLLWVLYISSFTVFYCMAYWLPSLLVGMGRTAEISAYASSCFGFGGLAAMFVVGFMMDRYGAIRVLSIAYLVAAVLLYFDGRYLADLSDASLLVALGISGFFMLGGYAGINVVLMSYYPADLRGLGAGWAKSAGRIGTILTPILIGIALQRGVSEQDVFSMFAIPAIMAMAAMLLIKYLKPDQS